VLVNHPKHNGVECKEAYTYKQKKNWISQLDWALCFISLWKHIKKFQIIQDDELPTNHAAIALSLNNLESQATHIRSCAEQLEAFTCPKQSRAQCIRRPILFQQINQEQFRNELPSLQQLSIITESTDIEEICTKVADIMYNVINKTQKK